MTQCTQPHGVLSLHLSLNITQRIVMNSPVSQHFQSQRTKKTRLIEFINNQCMLFRSYNLSKMVCVELPGYVGEGVCVHVLETASRRVATFPHYSTEDAQHGWQCYL